MASSNSYRTQFPDPDWHTIAEQAANETDPKKLAHLIKALCDRLEELQRNRRKRAATAQNDCPPGSQDSQSEK